MKLLSVFVVALTALVASAVQAYDEHAVVARAPSASPSVCNSSEVCPTCDHQDIRDASSDVYTVHCNTEMGGEETFVLEGNATRAECLKACDEFSGCFGVSYSGPEHCQLATGDTSWIIVQDGWTSFIRVNEKADSVASSTITSSTSKMHKTTSHTTSATTAPACHATAISCPHCDNQVVHDANNKPYHIYCDNQLYASSDYDLQQWASPQGCLAACDNFTWCYGATFWPQGNCQFAKGPGDVFPQDQPGYTAFLPVASTTKAPPPPGAPSAYPSDSGYSVASMVTNSYFLPSTSSASPTPVVQTAPFCNLPNVTCPDCNSITIMDAEDEPYRVHCSVQPQCSTFANPESSSTSNITQTSCLSACDKDAICLAAWWDAFAGTCQLCEDSLEGFLPTGQEPTAFVVFVAVNDGDGNGTTSSASGSGGIATTTSLVPITVQTVASSTRTTVSLAGPLS